MQQADHFNFMEKNWFRYELGSEKCLNNFGKANIRTRKEIDMI